MQVGRIKKIYISRFSIYNLPFSQNVLRCSWKKSEYKNQPKEFIWKISNVWSETCLILRILCIAALYGDKKTNDKKNEKKTFKKTHVKDFENTATEILREGKTVSPRLLYSFKQYWLLKEQRLVAFQLVVFEKNNPKKTRVKNFWIWKRTYQDISNKKFGTRDPWYFAHFPFCVPIK